MSFLSIFDAVGPVVNKILDFIPDPAQKLAAQEQLMGALKDWDSQQTTIDTAEASNPNLFVAGWRPGIGWACCAAIWYQYIIIPFATWGFAAAHMTVPIFPALDNNLWQLVTGMLGFGGLRTFEKIKGVASK